MPMNEERLVELINEMKKGDLDSFNEFYELVKKPVFYNIQSYTKSYQDSEDILHDTFVKFLNNIQKIDTSSSILGYLMAISKNLALDCLKKRSKVKNMDDELQYMSTSDKYDVDKDILLERIRRVLKDKDYEIFVLHALSDMTFEEISKVKKRPLGTILWSYNNSIKKIRKEIAL